MKSRIMHPSWLYLFFILFLFGTLVDATKVRFRPSHSHTVESSTSHEAAFHPDNTMALRNLLHGKRCTICLEDMNKNEGDHLVACAHSKGAHGFHLECLKNNILQRHTKCPLCGDAVALPVSDYELKKIYQKYLNDLHNVIDKYSKFKLVNVIDVIKEPFHGDMIELAKNMTIRSGQKKYLLEHLPNDWNHVQNAYKTMLSSYFSTYQSLYLANTHAFVESVRDQLLSNLTTSQEMQHTFRNYLFESIEHHTWIQQVWWHTLDIEWIVKKTLDTFSLTLPIQQSFNEEWQKLMQWCDTSEDAISDAMLEAFTSSYRSYQSNFATHQQKCTTWQAFIPQDIRDLFYPKTSQGQLCREADEKHHLLHENISTLAARVVKIHLLVFEFSIKRSKLGKKAVANFLEALLRQDSPLLTSIYETFRESRAIGQVKATRNDNRIERTSSLHTWLG